MARRMNMDRARGKQREIESRKEGEVHELKTGWNYFFLGGPWSDLGDIWKEVERHGLLVCPERAGLRKCKMCAEIRKALREGDTAFADEWELKTTAYLNACRKEDLKRKDPNSWKALRLSPASFAELVEWVVDEDCDPSDPSNAYVLGIKKTGSGLQTRYKVKMSKNGYNIEQWVDDAFMSTALVDLDALRWARPASDEDLVKAITGDGEEGDRKRARRSIDDDGFQDSPKPSSRNRGLDDDDFEEAGDLEDDFADDPAPEKKDANIQKSSNAPENKAKEEDQVFSDDLEIDGLDDLDSDLGLSAEEKAALDDLDGLDDLD